MSRVFNDLIDAKRILREIKLLRHLGSHDNVIEIFDLMTGPPDTEDFHTLYIVTQLFECDLERIITSSQRLTDQHAQYFVYQILRGLKFIHSAHVLHRDLKPSNILVNRLVHARAGCCVAKICECLYSFILFAPILSIHVTYFAPPPNPPFPPSATATLPSATSAWRGASQWRWRRS